MRIFSSPVFLIVGILCVIIGGATIIFSTVLPDEVAGVPRVVDGDTIVIGKYRIRLYGIDAPESHQLCRVDQFWRCGDWATYKLDKLIDHQKVDCIKKDVDVYHRIVATCRIDELDLGNAMVRIGAAIAYRQYTDLYIEPERRAKEEHVGIWHGEFRMPSEWRKLYGHSDEYAW